MEHLNPVDQARQLAAEVVKRLGQLNLHRRELERKLHVANGFFTSLEEKIVQNKIHAAVLCSFFYKYDWQFHEV